MKKWCCFLLFAYVSAMAQTSDLASLSSGAYTGSTGIFEKNNELFGYIVYYDYGLIDKSTKKMEYVILDKNLNKVANKIFEAEKFVGSYTCGRIDHRREIELRPILDNLAGNFTDFKTQKLPQMRKINLEKNEISLSEEICYKDKTFSVCETNKTFKELQKEQKADRKKEIQYKSDVVVMEDGTYLVYEYYIDNDKVSDNAYIKFDKDYKEVWRYEYNKGLGKKQFETTKVLNFDQENIYMVQTFREKTKITSLKFLRLDIKTGKIVAEIPIENFDAFDLNNILTLRDSEGYFVGNKKIFDDKLVFLGRCFEDGKSGSIGFYRFIFDKNTNQGKFDILKYTDAEGKMYVQEDGGVGENFYLSIRDVFILADGTVDIMFEKYKFNAYGGRSVATDLVLFKTDATFLVKDVKVFQKSKSVNQTSDYLFSQYLNSNKDVVFFYRDYEKDDNTSKKNWNLYINTIKDGKFNQEKIVISSKKDFYIVPSLAKEGYVLLREYNKDFKYNQIRLERLNY